MRNIRSSVQRLSSPLADRNKLREKALGPTAGDVVTDGLSSEDLVLRIILLEAKVGGSSGENGSVGEEQKLDT